MSDMISIKVDEKIQKEAAIILAEMGVTVSEAFQMLLVRIAREKELPFEPYIPGPTTIAAIEAANRGELAGPFNTMKELFADLNADD